MKWIIWLGLSLVAAVAARAQKETFDVLSYSPPRDWQRQETAAAVQFAVVDQPSGDYAMAVFSRALPTTASARENFHNQWRTLVRGSVSNVGEPTPAEPAASNGWEIRSGTANYTDRGYRGLAVLLSATGHGRTVTAVFMTNSQKYQADLVAFLQSLELGPPADLPAAPTLAPVAPASGGVTGLWVYYTLETNGRFANGSPMYTAGYFRREYLIKPDGTYVYRRKNWSVLLKEIFYARETGTWRVAGDRITFSPTSGRAGSWAKAASGRTTEWGALVKDAEWKLETVTYPFELHYYSGMNQTDLQLTLPQPTARDGGDLANPASYSPRSSDASLIDDPPGAGP